MEITKLGLKENWTQFTLLVIINAFVGGMVGLERSILPQIAEAEFHIAAKTAVLSFIVVFGIVKAITNYFTGSLANKVGRKIGGIIIGDFRNGGFCTVNQEKTNKPVISHYYFCSFWCLISRNGGLE